MIEQEARKPGEMALNITCRLLSFDFVVKVSPLKGSGCREPKGRSSLE
jgi:hypothetical protein